MSAANIESASRLQKRGCDVTLTEYPVPTQSVCRPQTGQITPAATAKITKNELNNVHRTLDVFLVD